MAGGTGSEQHMEGVAVLARCPLLLALALDEIGRLLQKLTRGSLSLGAMIAAVDDGRPRFT